MTAAVETMAYVGETPWHGLGTDVDEAFAYDAPAFIEAAGLNWEADKRQLFRKVGDEVKPANAWEVIRSTDGKVLADSVGARYTILQNKDAFNWFQPWLETKEAALNTAGALFEGSRIWVLAKLNRDPMEIAVGDVVEKYVLLSHSHDGSLAVRVGFCPVRVVCSNTLAMAHSDRASKLLRIKHSKNVHTNLDNIRETMNLINQEFEATAEQYRLLATKQINQNDVKKYVKKVFGLDEADDGSTRKQNIMEEVLDYMETGVGNDLPSVRGSYWQAYQGINYYLNYVNGRNSDNRLNSLWFGQNQKMNEVALASAVEMALAV